MHVLWRNAARGALQVVGHLQQALHKALRVHSTVQRGAAAGDTPECSVLVVAAAGAAAMEVAAAVGGMQEDAASTAALISPAHPLPLQPTTHLHRKLLGLCRGACCALPQVLHVSQRAQQAVFQIIGLRQYRYSNV